jgi:alkaline phosphatase D
MTLQDGSRRQILRGAALMAGMALLPSASGVLAASKLKDNPFTLGVASGEPKPDGMVLWTRLAPKPLEPDGGMGPEPVAVRWQLGLDPQFRRLEREGRVLATAEAGHSVHIELNGLQPGRDYWYRFMVPGGKSQVGRTRTAPPIHAKVDRLRLCFASCQKYESGHYGAYRHMVEDAPDLILFLGDYIYEGNPGSLNAVRLHQNPEPKDLAGYRARYATYKSDPMLQAAHTVAPWSVIWDDHEVANDYGGARDQDAGDPVAFLKRRAAAYQAYYEHMPLRRGAVPVGPDMLLYRKLDWGNLAQIQLVDDRQYRSEPVCRPPAGGRGKLISDCADRRDPSRSMLGQDQEAWLLDALTDSPALWNLLAQQTLFAPAALPSLVSPTAPSYSADGWDGSPATRERILQRWTEAKVSNPLTLGGDIHTFAASDLAIKPEAPPVATEFVGGSITSFGLSDMEEKIFKSRNPHLKFFEGGSRGYGLMDVTADSARVAFRALADARDPNSTVSDLARFVVENGKPGVVAG